MIILIDNPIFYTLTNCIFFFDSQRTKRAGLNASPTLQEYLTSKKTHPPRTLP